MVTQYTQDIDLTFSPPESRLTPIACHIFSEHGGNNSSSQVHIHQRANSGFSERSSARRSFRQSDFGLKRRHLWATLHLQMPEILDLILPCPLALVAVHFQASLYAHICWGVYQNYPAMLQVKSIHVPHLYVKNTIIHSFRESPIICPPFAWQYFHRARFRRRILKAHVRCKHFAAGTRLAEPIQMRKDDVFRKRWKVTEGHQSWCPAIVLQGHSELIDYWLLMTRSNWKTGISRISSGRSSPSASPPDGSLPCHVRQARHIMLSGLYRASAVKKADALAERKV